MTIPIDIFDAVRAALGLGIVWANWRVYRGVTLEEERDPWLRETGKRLLLSGLFFETALALFLLFADSYISIGQRAEIAEASTRAANAETELSAYLRPRRLTDEQKEKYRELKSADAPKS